MVKDLKAKLKRELIKYTDTLEEIKKLEAIKKELNASIKTMLEDQNLSSFQVNHQDFSYKVVYIVTKKDNFDSKKFQEDYPELYEKYKTQSSYSSIRAERKFK